MCLVRTSRLLRVLRRDLPYVSANRGFCFLNKSLIFAPVIGHLTIWFQGENLLSHCCGEHSYMSCFSPFRKFAYRFFAWSHMDRNCRSLVKLINTYVGAFANKTTQSLYRGPAYSGPTLIQWKSTYIYIYRERERYSIYLQKLWSRVQGWDHSLLSPDGLPPKVQRRWHQPSAGSFE